MYPHENTRTLTGLGVLMLLLWGCAAPLSQVQPSLQPEATPENVIPSEQKPEELGPPMLTQKSSSRPGAASSQTAQKSSTESSVTSTSKPAPQNQEPLTATNGLSSSTTSTTVIPSNPEQTTVASRSAPPDKVFNASDGLNLNGPTLRMDSSTQAVQVGDQFILSIEADLVKDLFSAPFYLQYDPQLLEFIGLTEGKLLNQDGKPTVFIYNVDTDSGQIIVGLSRLGDVGGITGSGVLALATFKAKNPGTATVAFQNVDFRDVRLEPVDVAPAGGEIQVR